MKKLNRIEKKIVCGKCHVWITITIFPATAPLPSSTTKETASYRLGSSQVLTKSTSIFFVFLPFFRWQWGGVSFLHNFRCCLVCKPCVFQRENQNKEGSSLVRLRRSYSPVSPKKLEWTTNNRYHVFGYQLKCHYSLRVSFKNQADHLQNNAIITRYWFFLSCFKTNSSNIQLILYSGFSFPYYAVECSSLLKQSSCTSTAKNVTAPVSLI